MDTKEVLIRAKKWLIVNKVYLLGLLVPISLLFVYDSVGNFQSPSSSKQKQLPQGVAAMKVSKKAEYKWGFDLNQYDVASGTIQKNEFLSNILERYDVPYENVHQLSINAKDIFSVSKLRAGYQYHILTNKECGNKVMVYEPSVYKFVTYELDGNIGVDVYEKDIVLDTVTSSGIIESSLWNAMVDNGMDFELAAKMEDALAWSVDFHHIQKEDRFRLIYEQEYIDGKKAGIGKIIGAYYKNYGNEYYAIRYKNEKHDGFYDENGRTMEKVFLKAPLKYSRISSRYNKRRFHPVLKRVKPHLGTDYAAPYGTPIYAVGNGVVTKASRTRGNGNYVKIKHDKIYSTQYLHMQKFAKGIRPGIQVKQGQVIGYVGSTGLATGPHVCFRFWKNNKQVDHLRLNFPPPEPLPKEDLTKFFEVRDIIKKDLDAIPYQRVEKEGVELALNN